MLVISNALPKIPIDRVERLLGAGYFTAHLPPAFTTRDLAAAHSSLYSQWFARATHAPRSKAEIFSMARAGHHRRVISLPNPVAQTFLATHIAQNWKELIKHFRKTTLSAGRPRFLRKADRATSHGPTRDLYETKIVRAAGYRYMLQSDISRFFPTIYTHVIPWALHGKTKAKQNTSQSLLGNLLDTSVRRGQDKQTLGLPIGPDTSQILAEVIATAVDVKLKTRLKTPKFPSGLRYVDDYYLFFSTSDAAKAALAELVASLREFELEANFSKTRICSAIEITQDFWSHQLRSAPIAERGLKQQSDIHHFFELAKQLAQSHPIESVMTYALKRFTSILVRKDTWSVFESHLCHVALAYPETLEVISRLLFTYASVGYPLDKVRLSRLLNAVIEDHAPLAHHSEVAWSLWIAKELDLAVEPSSVDLVAQMHSSVCALLLLDLASAFKLPKQPDVTYWKKAETKKALNDDLWLLSYEAGRRGWANFSSTHIQTDQYFSSLLSINASFYDTGAQSKLYFRVRPEALAEKRLSMSQALELDDAGDLLEYEDDDDTYGTPSSSLSDGASPDRGDDDDEPSEADDDDDPAPKSDDDEPF